MCGSICLTTNSTTLLGLAQSLRNQYPNATSMEFYETLEWLVDEQLDEVNRIYFWSNLNAFRYLWSHDFGFIDKLQRSRVLCGGGKTGSQALLQRLNETYIRRGLDPQVESLARVARSVVRQQFHEVAIGHTGMDDDNFFGILSDLCCR